MLSPADRRVVERQIGRPPTGAVAVAHRCPYGYPQVILTHPLHRQGAEFVVFPTLFWLSCPYLTAEVARVESGGGVRRYEDLLAVQPDLVCRYAEAHESYRRERAALLSPEERGFLGKVGALDRLQTGIAGLSNRQRVKCLHAHLAHFLARGGNPIGESVAAELPALFCPPQRIMCAEGVTDIPASSCLP